MSLLAGKTNFVHEGEHGKTRGVSRSILDCHRPLNWKVVKAMSVPLDV